MKQSNKQGGQEFKIDFYSVFLHCCLVRVLKSGAKIKSKTKGKKKYVNLTNLFLSYVDIYYLKLFIVPVFNTKIRDLI